MNRNTDVSLETHFHIRWPSGMKDWERHDTRAEAEQSATQLARPGETHAIEECYETGGTCAVVLHAEKRAAG